MSILGIKNRTENWKTVEHFHGLSGKAKARLAQKLSGAEEPVLGKVKIELFWKGARDYVYRSKKSKEKSKESLKSEFIESYECLFSDLREKLDNFCRNYPKYRSMRYSNYDLMCGERMENEEKLYSNLYNTEIDIVLQT